MSPATKLLFMLALGLALAATALADDYNKKHEGGPCKGGYWPDGKGCCPEMIKGRAYYRDGNKCYPKDLGCGVYYADGRGYYPDEKGNYAKDGESCSWERKCHERCIRPDHYDEKDCDKTTTTTEECPKETTSTRKETTSTKKHTTTTERRTTPKRTTTTEECPKETTTTKRHTTTTEECPKETTTKKETTTTKKHTTTEECPKETSTTKRHTTTTEECRKTTTEKPCEDDKKCPGGQWKDGHGCCPRKVGREWRYRDAQGCYPIELDCGVFYADAQGCYPDEHGKYLKAGECCPDHRKCCPDCFAPKGNNRRFFDAGVDYDFVPVTNWPEAKARLTAAGKLAFGQVPLYEEPDGLTLVQSSAIARHLARKHGYNGASPHEAALIDQANEGVADTFTAIAKVIFGTPADQQAEAKQKLVGETLPAQLPSFERLLERNGDNGHLVGARLSYADVALWVALQLVFGRVEGSRDALLGAFPAVKRLVDGVSQRERVKAYLARDVYNADKKN